MNTITNENVQMLFSLLNKMLDRQEIIIDQLGTLNDTAEITMINTITAGDNDVVNGNILADSLTEESPDQETAYGLEDGFAVEENEVGDGVPELTPLERIEFAAAEDVYDLSLQNHLPYKWFGSTSYHYTPEMASNVRFSINSEKRTIAAFLLNDGAKVKYRGVAKCHPDDHFSLNIGIAIALRRLFQLDIPEEYIEKA